MRFSSQQVSSTAAVRAEQLGWWLTPASGHSHERSPVDEALGRPHQDAVLALVDTWGQKAQAADAAGDELDGPGTGSSPAEQEQQAPHESPVRKHLPPESMDLG